MLAACLSSNQTLIYSKDSKTKVIFQPGINLTIEKYLTCQYGIEHKKRGVIRAFSFTMKNHNKFKNCTESFPEVMKTFSFLVARRIKVELAYTIILLRFE